MDTCDSCKRPARYFVRNGEFYLCTECYYGAPEPLPAIPPCTAQGCTELAEGMGPHGDLLCGDHYEKWYPTWVVREDDDRWQIEDYAD